MPVKRWFSTRSPPGQRRGPGPRRTRSGVHRVRHYFRSGVSSSKAWPRRPHRLPPYPPARLRKIWRRRAGRTCIERRHTALAPETRPTTGPADRANRGQGADRAVSPSSSESRRPHPIADLGIGAQKHENIASGFPGCQVDRGRKADVSRDRELPEAPRPPYPIESPEAGCIVDRR